MKNIYQLIVSLPILFTLLLSIVFIGIGIHEGSMGVYGVVIGKIHSHLHPGLKLLDALDMFLISFVFMIFSLGFTQLFLNDSALFRALDGITPQWLKVKSFTELKLLLWETILTSMVIIFASQLLKEDSVYKWEYLIIPIGILLISLSAYLVRKGKSAPAPRNDSSNP